MLLVLYASQLGDLFAWSTQQHGRVVHDLFPIAGDGRKQLGSGSDGLLWWHTEDAFHPHRCDYLGLFCLRNSNQVATTIGSNSAVASIDPRFVQILFESRFTILPDESHLEAQPPAVPGLGGDGSSDAALRRAYAKMQALNAKPPAVAALFGDPAAPYLRVDPFFMKALDDEAARALDALTRAIDEHLCDLVVQPGEACFIDNFRAVHGRRPFKANYDGTDRWLKRVNITRDVRKSRDCRLSSDARVVY
jgi:Fe(II)/alpha-ketoglutarate-dependent arginine beta-hydroxylase